MTPDVPKIIIFLVVVIGAWFIINVYYFPFIQWLEDMIENLERKAAELENDIHDIERLKQERKK